MVRDAATRRKRYIAGLDPDKIAANLRSEKDGMIEQESTYFAEIHGVEQKAKRIVEAAGVDTAGVAQYVNVARQCYSKAKRFTGQTLTDECQHIVNHWASRGYIGSLLARVCNISGCGVLTPAPETVPAACDCGDVLYCGPLGWTRLPAGVDGQLLTSHGFCKAPTWEDPPEGPLPREYFEHFHRTGSSVFPPLLGPTSVAGTMWKIPSNWNGFSKIRIWLVGGANDASVPITVSIYGATCGEVVSTHADSKSFTIATSNGYFTCVEIQASFATLLAAVQSCDLLFIAVANNDGSTSFLAWGVEVIEASA